MRTDPIKKAASDFLEVAQTANSQTVNSQSRFLVVAALVPQRREDTVRGCDELLPSPIRPQKGEEMQRDNAELIQRPWGLSRQIAGTSPHVQDDQNGRNLF